MNVLIPALALLSPAPKHRIVIEVNHYGTMVYDAVLGNAKNLLKALGPNDTEIEIVCLGDGVDMLLPVDKKNLKQMKALSKAGVNFAVCGNTMDAQQITAKQLIMPSTRVDSGVAEVVRKEEEGWSYFKGG